MLRITQLAEGDTTVTLKLEGRIVGQWVEELRKECEIRLADQGKIILDLSGVSFADNQGIKTLKAMIGDQVQLRGCSVLLRGLIKGAQCWTRKGSG